MEAKTYTNRNNARRAGVAAGVPAELVEITVHKNGDEVRFGWKAKQPPANAAQVAANTPAATATAYRMRACSARCRRAGGDHKQAEESSSPEGGALRAERREASEGRRPVRCRLGMAGREPDSNDQGRESCCTG